MYCRAVFYSIRSKINMSDGHAGKMFRMFYFGCGRWFLNKGNYEIRDKEWLFCIFCVFCEVKYSRFHMNIFLCYLEILWLTTIVFLFFSENFVCFFIE